MHGVHLVVRLNWIGTTEPSNWIGCAVHFYAHDTVADRTLCVFLFLCGCHQCRCALLLLLDFVLFVLVLLLLLPLLLASCTNAWRITMAAPIALDSRLLPSICLYFVFCACVCIFIKLNMWCVWTIYHNNNWSETTMEVNWRGLHALSTFRFKHTAHRSFIYICILVFCVCVSVVKSLKITRLTSLRYVLRGFSNATGIIQFLNIWKKLNLLCANSFQFFWSFLCKLMIDFLRFFFRIIRFIIWNQKHEYHRNLASF